MLSLTIDIMAVTSILSHITVCFFFSFSPVYKQEIEIALQNTWVRLGLYSCVQYSTEYSLTLILILSDSI